jgi:hypothetical protein
VALLEPDTEIPFSALWIVLYRISAEDPLLMEIPLRTAAIPLVFP